LRGDKAPRTQTHWHSQSHTYPGKTLQRIGRTTHRRSHWLLLSLTFILVTFSLPCLSSIDLTQKWQQRGRSSTHSTEPQRLKEDEIYTDLEQQVSFTKLERLSAEEDYTELDRACTDPGRQWAKESYTRHQKIYTDPKRLTARIAYTETKGTGEQANRRSSTLLRAAGRKNQQQIRKNTRSYRGSTPAAEEGRVNITSKRRSHQTKKSRSRNNLQRNVSIPKYKKNLQPKTRGAAPNPEGRRLGEEHPVTLPQLRRGEE
jgi:hypothetical protein